jgi:nitrate/nitrite transporter NarK
MMLALGTAAQTAACAFVYGVPYLADELRGREGLSLTQVGVLVACPTAGLVLALYLWGAAADRWGERVVIALGLGGAAGALGGMLMAKYAGFILQTLGSYQPIFLFAAVAYLAALAVVHLLLPTYAPVAAAALTPGPLVADEKLNIITDVPSTGP